MRTHLLSTSFLVAWMAVANASAVRADVTNPDLEDGELGKVPTGWFFPPFSANAGYAVRLTDDRPNSGKRCVELSKEKDTGRGGFGNLMQACDATAYRGKRVRLKSAVRVEGDARAQLWLRIDRPKEQAGFFDNMGDRPIMSKDWAFYEIVGDVAKDAASINLGLMLLGRGKAWLDAVTLEAVGQAGEGNEPPRPLVGRGLDNLVAFTRLLGYVRYFHPSDEAAKADWETVALAGAKAVEQAKDPTDLAEVLEKVFRPLAPTVRVVATGEKLPQVPKRDASKLLVWQHLGVGTGAKMSIYNSRRTDLKAAGSGIPKNVTPPSPERPFTADLGGGVTCLVPLAIHADDTGTLPHGTAVAVATGKPAGFKPTGNDRTSRLAIVALAWNVFQHFYPYFDAVKTDWPAVLRESLSSAATDPDDRAFLDTLRRLVADLHDGHGNVMGGVDTGAYPLPFAWDWIEDRLVVTRVAKDGAGPLRPGDIIVKVEDKPAAEALAKQERLISGATPQWRRYLGVQRLGSGPVGEPLLLTKQTDDGPLETFRVKRGLPRAELKEPRPEKVAEIKPGIMYIDLDRINDADFQKALPQLEKAKGIIFELRGYPSQVSTRPLAHLIDEPITCAQWHIPVVFYPDRKDTAFQFSNWKVLPQQPRFKAKVAFLTDGRAISYAETYLGMVEHYKLADIVGSPTAGTNGNVNPTPLPGGYQIMWTGMKVLKHDGSRHHGVGIQPTVPVARTIKGVKEGRDEVLEKAVEIVSRQ